MRTFILSLAVAFLTSLVNIFTAAAQIYPSRPITMIVPFAPGGPTDFMARLIAEAMRSSLGQAVVIENVVGADGSVGTGKVARAAPDGYTLSFGTVVSHVFNGAAYRLEYDVLNDFESISLIAFQSFLIVGKREIPADNLKGLIELLKRNPDKLSIGVSVTTSAVGSSPSYAAGVFFQKATGTRLRLLTYRGVGPALQALLSGQIDFLIESVSVLKPHLRNLKPFAIMAKSRSAMVADLPTVDEAGAIGLYASQWTALWAPKNTSSTIIKNLNGAVVKSLSAVRRRLSDNAGQELPEHDQQSPEALAIFHKAEINKWWPILKTGDIRAQ
jgi:tripartite-type tricarboxylate transporter receptor subunit TctC